MDKFESSNDIDVKSKDQSVEVSTTLASPIKIRLDEVAHDSQMEQKRPGKARKKSKWTSIPQNLKVTKKPNSSIFRIFGQ